jgi:CheY-like chemotaxis protein
VIRLLETILVVEDHDDSRRMLEDVLTLAGFRVLAAHNGAEALRALGQEPHLVVLKLVLPWISGIEVLSTIRETPHLAAVPVLIVHRNGHERVRAAQLRSHGPHAEAAERGGDRPDRAPPVEPGVSRVIGAASSTTKSTSAARRIRLTTVSMKRTVPPALHSYNVS